MGPLLVAHILGSALVGFVGRRRRIGFIGFFLVSLLVTPVITVVILFLTAPKPDAKATA